MVTKYGVPSLLPDGTPNPEYGRRKSEAQRRAKGIKPRRPSKYGVPSLIDGKYNPEYDIARRRAAGAKPHPENWGNTYGVPYSLPDGSRNPAWLTARNRAHGVEPKEQWYELHREELVERGRKLGKWHAEELRKSRPELAERHEKVCQRCGKTFQKKKTISLNMWAKQKYCSRECGIAVRADWLKSPAARPYQKAVGQKNVKSGHLDRIRPLADAAFSEWIKEHPDHYIKMGKASAVKQRAGHEKIPDYALRHIEALKIEALAVVGEKCVHCGETNPAFLTFGHIHNDGAKWRKQYGYGSTNTAQWIIDHPDEARRVFQTECWNFNCSKQRGNNDDNTDYKSVPSRIKNMEGKAVVNPEYTRRYNNFWRVKFFDHFGWKCVCCGEDNPKYLVAGHPNSDGAEHRRKLGFGSSGGIKFYRDVVRRNFIVPYALETSCWNCNCGADANNGICPHKMK